MNQHLAQLKHEKKTKNCEHKLKLRKEEKSQ